MRPHPNDDVEVASWTAHPRASFARQTHPCAVSRPGWDFHFEPPGAHHDATALAGVADRTSDLAAAAAGRARLLTLEVQGTRRSRVGFFQRNLGCVLDVLAAHRPPAPPPPAAKEVEQILEALAARGAAAPQQVIEVELVGLPAAACPSLGLRLFERLGHLPAI